MDVPETKTGLINAMANKNSGQRVDFDLLKSRDTNIYMNQRQHVDPSTCSPLQRPMQPSFPSRPAL